MLHFSPNIFDLSTERIASHMPKFQAASQTFLSPLTWPNSFSLDVVGYQLKGYRERRVDQRC
jgi:hypothetical protein